MGDAWEIKSLTGGKIQEILSDPQRMNAYSYSRNNPIVNSDPAGTDSYYFNNGQVQIIGSGKNSYYEKDDIKMLNDNAQFMQNHLYDLYSFANLVKPGGQWDYKRQNRYFFYNGNLVTGEDFGNINFGFSGAAAGVASGFLADAAGAVQVYTNTSKPEFYLTNFDDPRDTEKITSGISGYTNSSFASTRSSVVSAFSENLYESSGAETIFRTATAGYYLVNSVYQSMKSLFNSIKLWF